MIESSTIAQVDTATEMRGNSDNKLPMTQTTSSVHCTATTNSSSSIEWCENNMYFLTHIHDHSNCRDLVASLQQFFPYVELGYDVPEMMAMINNSFDGHSFLKNHFIKCRGLRSKELRSERI